MNSSLSQPSAVLFDLDGTLVDSLPDIRTAINRVLAENGRRAVELAEVRDGVGHGAAQLIVHCFAVTGAPVGDDLPVLLARYQGVYEEGIALETRAYPGVELMLQTLRERGHPLGICTNKPSRLAVHLLEALNLGSYFAAVVGGDLVPHRKPHGDHPRATLAAMGLGEDGRRVLFVGDSENDVAAARAAVYPIAVVRFGYARQAPENLGADVLIESFSGFCDKAAEFL